MQAYCDYAETVYRLYGPVKEPQWTTPNEVVAVYPQDDPIMELRRWVGPKSNPEQILEQGAPTAGHGPTIIDYGRKQSQVQAALDMGYTVYSPVTLKARRGKGWAIGINQLVEADEYFLDLMTRGGKLPIVTSNDCQKGWEWAIVNARNNDVVKASIYVGSPIDFTPHDGGDIEKWAATLPMAAYEWMVYINNGVMPGEYMRAGFSMINYEKFIEQYVTEPIKLFGSVSKNDKKALDRSERFQEWWRSPWDVNGKMYLEAVGRLFKNNELIKGEFDVAGQHVLLSRITRPTWVVWGAKEDITTKKQAIGILDAISTPEEDKHYVEIEDVGHIGSYMARKSIATIREVFRKAGGDYVPQVQRKKFFLGGVPVLSANDAVVVIMTEEIAQKNASPKKIRKIVH